MNTITLKEINALHVELIDIRDEMWKDGLIKNGTVVYQSRWREIAEIEPFINELSYERVDPVYHGDVAY